MEAEQTRSTSRTTPHLGYETSLPRLLPHTQPHKEELCDRRGVFFLRHRCFIETACAQAAAIRGAPYAARRHADVPRALPLRVAQDDWERNDFHERVRA